jgi:cation:H+ antiporter
MGFTKSDRLKLGVLALSFIPFVLTVLLGVERGSPFVVMLATGTAIASAGFALAWGTESLQFVVSQVLALALLAIVQVVPEYSVEVVLAYKGAFDPTILQYATAGMTGANRLLLGLGWPSVFLLSALAARKTDTRRDGMVLGSEQAVEVLFLGIATAYSFLIVAKGTLGVLDAAALLSIFAVYLYIAKRLPRGDQGGVEELEGPSLAVARMKGGRKALAMGGLLGVGSLVVLFGSTPFVESVISVGASLNVNEYLLIQWLAPVLTELPEATTAFYWASKEGKGPVALANLVSSKLNQWTLLVATIPLVFSVALGGFGAIRLTGLQQEEIFLTAAQSLFGFACLVDLRLTRGEAVALFVLFATQFLVPEARVEVSVVYLLLAAYELVAARRALKVVDEVRTLFMKHL